MKTKLLALILAVSLIVGLLAGCGSKAPATSEPGVVDTSKEVNLVMYVISDRPAGLDIVDENLNKILKEKMNLEEKEDFIATRKGILDPNTLSKEERIALIREWIVNDESLDDCDIDLWDMYHDYINGEREIAEINAAFQADYYMD